MKLKAIDSVQVTEFGKIELADFPDFSYKFASLNFALKNSSPAIQKLINSCPIQGNHKNIVVDLKVHELKTGEIPALPHWHFDCIGDPRDEALEEVHHLYITEGCLTEFLPKEVDISLPDRYTNKAVQGFEGQKIEPYKIYTYGRHLHRATPAEVDCVRLLVRVSETNKIKPNNRKFEPTYVRNH